VPNKQDIRTLILVVVLAALAVALAGVTLGFVAVTAPRVRSGEPLASIAATSPVTPTEQAAPLSTDTPRQTPDPGASATVTPLPQTAAPAETPAPPAFFEGPLVYGTSFGGRALVAYRFGSGPSVRAIIGGIHGGYEWNTVELVSRTLSFLQKNPAALPETITLYVIPCANPDGYAAGTDRERGRVNGNNVDLNRNWDYNWQPMATHGDRPVSGGSAPFSEPETAALRDFILNRRVEAAIFYHSAMARIFYGADSERWASLDLALALSEATGYPIAQGVPGQVTTGDAVDWMSAQGLAGVEIELTTHQDLDWERNRQGLEAFLAWQMPAAPRAPAATVQTFEIGSSVQGRPIEVTQIGAGRRVALVVAGAIHGDEGNTEALVRALMGQYLAESNTVPSEFRLFFLPAVNPDGRAAGTRANANGVDLNRNWPTDDWQPDAVRRGTIIPGSGGTAPGSEPEVQAIARWLLDEIKPAVEEVWLLSYHSPYAGGIVLPGYRAPGVPGPQVEQLARRIAQAAGYEYRATYPSDLPYTGEWIHWCEQNGIWSADIELPDSGSPDSVPTGRTESTLQTHRRVLDALLSTFITYDDNTVHDYEVQPGDTLSGIAEREGVSLEALMELNGITDPNMIQVGQVLRIP
jgi:murein tripeptide amidase MpaA